MFLFFLQKPSFPKGNSTKWLPFGEEEQRSTDELFRLRGSERSEVCSDDMRLRKIPLLAPTGAQPFLRAETKGAMCLYLGRTSPP